jgi:hypothetical protein
MSLRAWAIEKLQPKGYFHDTYGETSFDSASVCVSGILVT